MEEKAFRVCSAEGLSCSEAELRDHDAEVNTKSEMATVIKSLGIECMWGGDGYGRRGSDLEPLVWDQVWCSMSSSNRTAAYSCTAKGDKGWGGGAYGYRRLCWCS